MRRWNRASAAVARAEAAMAAAEVAQAGVRSRAEEFALEEVYSDRLADFYAAVKRMLRTPAPNVAALAVKIRYAVDHEVTTLQGGPRCMAAVKADAMRIGAQWATGRLPGPHPGLFAARALPNSGTA